MKKAVMYGAGNIGRGFIGQLLSQSGYEVIFLDINEKIIDTLNKDRKYKITTVSNENEQQIIIENIRAINTKTHEKEAIDAIATCDLMATAVGANVLKYIAPIVAKGILRRYETQKEVLNILLCENLLHVDKYLKNLIKNELGEESNLVLRNVGFVEASIGRMVPVMLEATYPTDITVESFEVLHTDKDGYIGELPVIKKMIAYAPFEVYIRRKLFMHNMGHAVTAYLAAIKGYTYIHEAISDIEIKYCVYACGIESAQAIATDGYPLKELINFYDRLIYRFNNKQLKDTVERVGRDTKRKLASNDRIVGAINLCKEKHIPYAYLLLGVASGLLFELDESQHSLEVFNDAKTDLRKAITKHTGISNDEDTEVISRLYAMLQKKDLTSAISFCEKFKSEKIVD
ncbi:hypothetical protein [Peloplasma aerotolerans]|uniref:Mannitol-1-phosphate 5-dehydrogenase n=1 Tax=Peloplasma aerotolerans TaxID=3044389 RepID=A0AAW6UBB0_9MOLU|nr:hypothetical protein [Mariniplasma sp. M4Ah]MDI6452806.1 hypothetical protein [Mariniplasma sp. M4Ah]